jgi:hypothetical protein
MPQKLLTESELVAHLNDELHKHEACADCHFEPVVKLVEPDAHGNNWLSPYLRCSGQRVSICTPIAEQVVYAARLLFNIK